MVVTPSATLVTPLILKVFMPSLTAALFISADDAPFKTSPFFCPRAGKSAPALESGLYGYLGRLVVPDLSDHYDVRVLPQKTPQGSREVKSYVLVYLHLVDAVEVELDRGFRGRYVLGYLVELGKRRVQGRCLAASRRPRYQPYAPGPVDRAPEVVQGLLLEAGLRHVELEVTLVQEPQDDLLAGQGREHGYPVVHLLALGELELYPAVLRQAPLGDVELA